MKSAIKFAVIQSGYAVFGTGATRDEAIADAANWMEPSDGGLQGDMTAEQVQELIVSRPVDGDFYIIEVGDDEFDSYLENQGGYVHADGEWFAE